MRGRSPSSSSWATGRCAGPWCEPCAAERRPTSRCCDPAAGRGGAPDVLHRHSLLAAAGAARSRTCSPRRRGARACWRRRSGSRSSRRSVPTTRTASTSATSFGRPRRPPGRACTCLGVRPGRTGAAAPTRMPSRHPGRWCASAARALADAVRRRSRHRRPRAGRRRPTGDFHEGQLTVRRDGRAAGASAGLLDVDTVGPGHRVDDLACLGRHAIALGPPGQAVARALGAAGACGASIPRRSRVRTAGVLLSLAAGAVHERGRRSADRSLLLDAARGAARPLTVRRKCTCE